MFGRQHRLEVAAVVGAQAPPIWARNIAQLTQIPENQVGSELATFELLGALQPFPAELDRRKIYQKVPHPLWALARQMLEGTIYRLSRQGSDVAIEEYWREILGSESPESLLD
jgi:hypothetical protein